MTFTETNVSDQPINVLTGPSDFQVAEDGSTIWESTSTGPGSAPSSGTWIPMSTTVWTTLYPGQSYIQMGATRLTATFA